MAALHDDRLFHIQDQFAEAKRYSTDANSAGLGRIGGVLDYAGFFSQFQVRHVGANPIAA